MNSTDRSTDRAPAVLHHEPEAVVWAREKAGLTQTQLGQRIGVGRSVICEYEAGTRSIPPARLREIAVALNCPLVALERKRPA